MVDDSHSWIPIDLARLEGRKPEPPSIGDLFYPGRLHLVSGEPESLKSWALLAVGVSEVQAGRTVVYVDFEMDPHEVRERQLALGLEAGGGLAPPEGMGHFVYLAPKQPIGEGQIRQDIEELMQSIKPSLVVFDSYTPALALHGCNPDVGVDIERFQRAVLAPFRAPSTAVVLADHLTKNSATRGRFSIGSERKLAACDVHLGFEVVQPLRRGGRGVARIVVHKDRPGFLPRPRAAELEMVSDPDDNSITWSLLPASHDQEDEAHFRPTALMEKVSRYLERQSEPVSRNTVERDVKGRGEYVRLAIDVLVSEEYVSETAGVRGARLLTSLAQFSATSSHRVPTSSRTTSSHLVPPCPPSTEGTGDTDEVTSSSKEPDLVPDNGEVERLLEKHADVARGVRA